MTAYEKLGEDLKALQNCQEWMIALPDDQLAKTSYDRIHNKLLEMEKQREKQKIKWSFVKRPMAEKTNFVEKSPFMASKKALKRVPIRIKKSNSPIPDAVIDKLFNNSTGEHVCETSTTDSKLFKANFLEKSFSKLSTAKASTAAAVSITMEPAKEKTIVNETNEILKAQSAIGSESIPTLEELQLLKTNHKGYSLPTTGPQFCCAWKSFCEGTRFMYLKDISESHLQSSFGTLIGAQMDSSLLSQIIQVIHKYFLHFKIPHVPLLCELSKNSELAILAMFLESDDKTSKHYPPHIIPCTLSDNCAFSTFRIK
jgi:hypothetical protein